MGTYHNPFQLLCIFFNFAVAILTTLVVFSSIAWQYGFQEALPNLLTQSLQDVADARPSSISPQPWAHNIWAALTLWHVLWALYGLVNVFRKTAGVPVYTSPVLLNNIALVTYIFSCGFTIAWFILYDRLYTSVSCLFIAMTCILTWVAYGACAYALNYNLYRLQKSERESELWWTRLLVHNGIAAMGTWSYFVFAFNLALALVHNPDIQLKDEIASIISLSIIGLYQVLLLILNITCFDRQTRSTMAPYILNIIILSAVLFRMELWSTQDNKFVLAAVLLAFAFLSLMVKCVFVAFRLLKGSSGGGEITSEYHHSTKATEAHYLLK
ncbi:uncharacterized protein LOC106066352 [Biomphalaria glabrata]|uniref:Uncharacterized protein LOC106066352 n=1 Tax=Biomphalaria glabrata TaxID=6526 RepID=A0A9W2YCN7_BIOGL|nr:uncharacterized protein LOC106066352 [Biomphalaria glabrata]